MDGFEYSCVVNGVSLIAQYENEDSILCTVGSGQVSACMVTTVRKYLKKTRAGTAQRITLILLANGVGDTT